MSKPTKQSMDFFIHVLVHVVFDDLPYVLVHFGSSGSSDILLLWPSLLLQKNRTTQHGILSVACCHLN